MAVRRQSDLTATRAIRQLWAINQRNTAVALIVGIAAGPDAKAIMFELAAMDNACAVRGHILPEEAIRREEIMQDAIRDLGFDPRTQDAPGPARTQPLPPSATLRELEDGSGFRFRDWRALWVQVEAGSLSECAAREIGAAWMSEPEGEAS
jgi:hypothetical protein